MSAMTPVKAASETELSEGAISPKRHVPDPLGIFRVSHFLIIRNLLITLTNKVKSPFPY